MRYWHQNIGPSIYSCVNNPIEPLTLYVKGEIAEGPELGPDGVEFVNIKGMRVENLEVPVSDPVPLGREGRFAVLPETNRTFIIYVTELMNSP